MVRAARVIESSEDEDDDDKEEPHRNPKASESESDVVTPSRKQRRKSSAAAASTPSPLTKKRRTGKRVAPETKRSSDVDGSSSSSGGGDGKGRGQPISTKAGRKRSGTPPPGDALSPAERVARLAARVAAAKSGKHDATPPGRGGLSSSEDDEEDEEDPFDGDQEVGEMMRLRNCRVECCTTTVPRIVP
eukprot:GHVU01221419.1.p1 GENE.GHVU01221419.1~~GHVU01221419.1.p1  ORF type:complete len:189 (+),score=37.93 GHVU01221419.1:217-783(+)